MFALSERDLDKNILGCGDGPASFNCIANVDGKKIMSVDSIYQLGKKQIEERIRETFHIVIEQTKENRDKFIWTTIKNVDELGKIRLSAMETFLNDYEAGKSEGRYLCAKLPNLPFPDGQCDLSLSSHFLFLHSENLSLDFHFKAINEMLRVSAEARIFPLLDVNSIRSQYVNEIVNEFSRMGYCAEESEVNYEFQKGGNRMLKIFRNK